VAVALALVTLGAAFLAMLVRDSPCRAGAAADDLETGRVAGHRRVPREGHSA